MSCPCKGICDSTYESQLKLGYKNGQKFCSVCQKYFVTDSFRCHCCRNLLRNKRRHNKQRFLLLQNNTKSILTITTSVKIREDQKQFLEKNSIAFSKYVRKKIDEDMKVKNWENISSVKCQNQ